MALLERKVASSVLEREAASLGDRKRSEAGVCTRVISMDSKESQREIAQFDWMYEHPFPYWSTTSNNTVSDEAIGVPLLMTGDDWAGLNSSARLRR